MDFVCEYVDYWDFCDFGGLWWGVELICVVFIEYGLLIVLLMYYEYVSKGLIGWDW